MPKIVKNIFEFFKIEDDKTENRNTNIKMFRLFYVFCTIAHTIFLLAFLYMRLTPLIIFSIISVSCYAFCLGATYTQKYYYTLALSFCEIIAFSFFSVVYLGWDMNIQYFMICIIPLGFFFQFKNIKCPLIATTFSGALYVVLLIYSNNIEPLFNLCDYGFIAAVIEYGSIITCLLGVILLSYLFSHSVRRNQRNLKHANNVLERIANTDSLTGLANRRSMINNLNQSITNLKERSIPAVVVIGDIDDFKKVNDTYGHDFGDVVLVELAKLMLNKIDNDGKVSRWGGEEFLILLDNCTKKEGSEIINDLRKSISLHVNTLNGEEVRITMTFGMSEVTSDTSIDTIISNADNKLYEGKKHGKNCVKC